ncbi:HesA/MoeB/ThiF family protein [Deinococcus lacus]|uniref:HesA/MoeB/ThiF family protein n=1 Tax=Deinococcus lacus TaxID=392561 RepID=A0ABW1YFB0_9DEIO
MADSLTRSELRRYSRALLVPEWAGAGAQQKLKASHVLVVGAGGLGCAVLTSLAGSGVGRITVSEGDTIDLSNLHRQPLYTAADLGRPKGDVAVARLQAVNPWCQVRAAPAFEPATARELLAEADLVVDATDNLETRYALDAACRAMNKSWVWGAASGTSGMVSRFDRQLGLEDIFPQAQAVGQPGESCDEAGVLGPVPQLVGQVMALEALKFLSGLGGELYGTLWTFEALTMRTRLIHLRQR